MASTPSLPPREQARDHMVQSMAKLGLQVNGAVANAQAVADAFNTFQASFNAYMEHVRNLEQAERENKALHETVTELKGRLAKNPKPAKTDKEAPAQKQ